MQRENGGAQREEGLGEKGKDEVPAFIQQPLLHTRQP